MRAKSAAASAQAGLFVALVIVLIVAPLSSAGALASGNDAGVLTSALAPVSSEGAGATLLRSDSEQIVLQINAPDYVVSAQMVAGSACQTVQAPGTVLSEEAGRPQLPYKVLLLGIPPQAEFHLETQTADTVQIAGDLPPCAAPQQVARFDAEGRVQEVTAQPARDAAVYGLDRLYPASARVVDLGFMRSQRIVRLEVTPVQVNPVTGQTLFHKQIRVSLQFKGGTASGAPVTEPVEFESAFQKLLLNYDSARAWRSAAPAAAKPAAAWTPPVPAYKIAVKEAGLYELTYSALNSAGLPVDQLNPATLQLFNRGQEEAIRVLDGGDGKLDPGDSVLFFGRGANTRYTDTNIYWLTYGGANGKRMTDRASAAGGTEPSAFRSPVRNERNLFYVSTLPMQSGYEHWYGSRIQVAGAGGVSGTDFTVNVIAPATGALTATLRVMLAGNTTGQHHVRALVGGQVVLNRTWNDRTLLDATADFPQSYLTGGNNTVRIELVNDAQGQTFDMIYVDWFEVAYGRTYAASGDRLEFGGDQAGAWQYRITGFTADAVEVYDVTDGANVTRITGATLTPEGGSYTLRFGDSQGTARRYLALATSQRLAPLSITADTASDLQTTSNGADYIIITHRDFWTAVQPLAARRTADGMRVKVVDVQDAYDEFGYGLMSAEAVRDFLAYAYASWTKPAPLYVLLVGDGNYDFRRYLATSVTTYLPPYLEMVDPDIGETVTDNRFVTLTTGDILPDMNVGRLPANTAAEATLMISKTIGYETAPSQQAWQQRALFATDDLSHGGGNFYQFSDNIADGYVDPPTNTVKLLPTQYVRTKVYMGQTCPQESPSVACRKDVIDALNAGTLLTSFVGHGTKTYWTPEYLMDITALTQLTNSDRLTIMLPMTCDNGYFAEPKSTDQSFGEASIRISGSGAVATWAPTGFGLASGHDLMERGLFLALFHEGKNRLGPATTQGKLYLVATAPPGSYTDLVDTFLLLGDPALKVPVEPARKWVYLPLIRKR